MNKDEGVGKERSKPYYNHPRSESECRERLKKLNTTKHEWTHDDVSELSDITEDLKIYRAINDY